MSKKTNKAADSASTNELPQGANVDERTAAPEGGAAAEAPEAHEGGAAPEATEAPEGGAAPEATEVKSDANLARAKEVFGCHTVDECHFTADGTAFIELQHARMHAESLADSKVVTINRSEV